MPDINDLKKQMNSLVEQTLVELKSTLQVMVNELGPEGGNHRHQIEQQLKSHLRNAFIRCNSPEEAKILYRAFALELHPDSSKPFMQNISEMAPKWCTAFLPMLKEIYTSYNNDELIENTYHQNKQTPPPLSTQKKNHHLNLSINEKIRKIYLIVSKSVAEKDFQKTLESLDNAVQKQFPEFYQYRRYYLSLQYLIYWSAFSLNTLLVGTVLIKDALRPFPLFWIENMLLEYIFGDNKSALALAYSQAYQNHMLYEENQRVDSSLEHFKTTAMAHFLQTPESQKAFLLEKFYSLDELNTKINVNIPPLAEDQVLSEGEQQHRAQLIQAEETFIFQKAFIQFTLADYDFNKQHQTIPSKAMKQLELLYEDNTLRDLDDISDKKLIADCFEIVCHYCDQTHRAIYTHANNLTGLDHLNALLESINIYWNRDDVPWLTRLLHSLVFLLTIPLTFIHLAWDGLSRVIDEACYLIKIAFTYLVNAPLMVYETVQGKKEDTPTTHVDTLVSNKNDTKPPVTSMKFFDSSASRRKQIKESPEEKKQDTDQANSKSRFGLD